MTDEYEDSKYYKIDLIRKLLNIITNMENQYKEITNIIENIDNTLKKIKSKNENNKDLLKIRDTLMKQVIKDDSPFLDIYSDVWYEIEDIVNTPIDKLSNVEIINLVGANDTLLKEKYDSLNKKISDFQGRLTSLSIEYIVKSYNSLLANYHLNEIVSSRNNKLTEIRNSFIKKVTDKNGRLSSDKILLERCRKIIEEIDKINLEDNSFDLKVRQLQSKIDDAIFDYQRLQEEYLKNEDIRDNAYKKMEIVGKKLKQLNDLVKNHEIQANHYDIINKINNKYASIIMQYASLVSLRFSESSEIAFSNVQMFEISCSSFISEYEELIDSLIKFYHLKKDVVEQENETKDYKNEIANTFSLFLQYGVTSKEALRISHSGFKVEPVFKKVIDELINVFNDLSSDLITKEDFNKCKGLLNRIKVCRFTGNEVDKAKVISEIENFIGELTNRKNNTK